MMPVRENAVADIATATTAAPNNVCRLRLPEADQGMACMAVASESQTMMAPHQTNRRATLGKKTKPSMPSMMARKPMSRPWVRVIYLVSLKSSRPINMRRISEVPAPIS